MLTLPEEPPSTIAEPAPVRAHPVVTLIHERPPRHYLAVEGDKLYPFTIAARAEFERYLQHLAIPLSDYTFANNIIWLSQKSGFYQLIEDCFSLFGMNGHCLTMLLPPLGHPENQRRALTVCFEIMDRYNPTPYVGEIEFVYADFARLLEGDSSRWLVERSLPDYIYLTADLIALRGNAYKTKRGEINQFRRAHPNHRVEVLGRQHWDGIRALTNTWLHNRLRYLTDEAIADFVFMVEQERQAIERALLHYDTLGLTGLALMIDDRLEGFTFGERINPQVGSVLVEKTNFAVAGAAQYLFREFAKTFADCTYINVGDDLGLENLRRVKMSYRPALFGDKVTLKRGAA